MRAKAEANGLVQAGQVLSDSELLQMIFEPGFSTAAQVTNLSGRGVGMDVVNFDAPLEQFPGKKAFINETIETLRSNLRAITSEIQDLIVAATEGRLSERGDERRFVGDFASLISGINGMLDTTLLPIEEGNRILGKLAAGDLGERVEIECRGDHKNMRDAINAMVDNLRAFAGNVSQAAGEVADGSTQMAASSQQLSEGATEQAAAAEEASASMEQMAANIKQNADNAAQTEKIARQSSKDAELSGIAVDKAVGAMRTIAEKISIVQEIARQTDLLALNAAVVLHRQPDHRDGCQQFRMDSQIRAPRDHLGLRCH